MQQSIGCCIENNIEWNECYVVVIQAAVCSIADWEMMSE